ncbi:hypothetical protein YC2023_002002 [Brassica napus]
MIAETGMLTVGVLGLWARLVRKPLLEFTGEIIQVASGVVSRIGVSDTASYVPLSSSTNNSSLPVSRRSDVSSSSISTLAESSTAVDY